MNRISRNLTTIYRTERLIARRQLAVIQQQAIMMALAGVAVLAGLILLNVSLFFVLQDRVSPAAAAAILAVGNIVIAVLLVSVATRASVDDEIAPAVEVRDLAIADIEDEIEDMAAEAREVVDAVKGFGANPLGSLTTILVPILTAVLQKKGN